MTKFSIKTPPNRRVMLPDGIVTLQFHPGLGNSINGVLNGTQAFVDGEVLRYCQPLVPFRTGALIRSGITGTVLGSGLVEYVTPYARFQYYQTERTRPYDARRGAEWFERMKTAHKDDILNGAEKKLHERG